MTELQKQPVVAERLSFFPKGRLTRHWHLQAHQCVEAIDIIHQSPKSAVWKPYTREENLVLVSANNPATQWVRYNGHFGKSLGKPAFTHATEVWGAPFGIGRRAVVSTIAAGAAKMREFGHGAPTLALGARHYIQMPKIANWKHIRVFAAQDVVRAQFVSSPCCRLITI